MLAPSKQSRGFTLLELLIVLAIFGLFAAMAYGGLNHVLNTRKRLEASLDNIAAWQRGFQKLRNDFQLVSRRTVRTSAGLSEAPLRFEEFSSRVEFTHSSWRNPLLAPRATIERVVVRYDEKEKTLLRESYGVMDRSREDDLRKQVLLTDVSDVEWRFMDKSRAWQTTWPPPVVGVAQDETPLAVELSLSSKEFPEVRWVFALGESKEDFSKGGGGGGGGGSGSSGTSTSGGNSSTGGASGGGSTSGGGSSGSNGGSVVDPQPGGGGSQ